LAHKAKKASAYAKAPRKAVSAKRRWPMETLSGKFSLLPSTTIQLPDILSPLDCFVKRKMKIFANYIMLSD
jgi:hypothetical protein